MASAVVLEICNVNLLYQTTNHCRILERKLSTFSRDLNSISLISE